MTDYEEFTIKVTASVPDGYDIMDLVYEIEASGALGPDALVNVELD